MTDTNQKLREAASEVIDAFTHFSNEDDFPALLALTHKMLAMGKVLALPTLTPEQQGYVPLSDDCKSVFIDGMGQVPLAKTISTPAQEVETNWPLRAKVWKRESTQEWVLDIDGTLGPSNMTCRHTQPLSVAYEDVPGLPTLYQVEPQEPADLDAMRGALAKRGLAIVPMLITRAMAEVLGEEDWRWEDLLAHAEAITEPEYKLLLSLPNMLDAEPGLTELRARFESDWAKRHHPIPMNTRTRDDGSYGDPRIQSEWEAFQADEALRSQGARDA